MKDGKWIYLNMLVGRLWLAVRDAIEAHQAEALIDIDRHSIEWYRAKHNNRKNYAGHPSEKHFQNADMWVVFSRLSDKDKLKLYSVYPSFKMRICFKNNTTNVLMLTEVDLSWSDRQRMVELEDYMKA